MTRVSHIVAVLVSTAIAVAAVPASAGAAEYIVRPDETVDSGSWLRAGSEDPHALLDDDVLQPDAPYRLWDYLYAYSNGSFTTEVGLAAPAIPSGEPLTGLTSYTYVAAGSQRPVTLELLSGATVLGSVTLPAGTDGAWQPIVAPAPTSDQLADLRLRASTGGTGASTASYIFATYAAVTTAAPATDVTPTPTGGDPAAGAGGDTTPGTGGDVPAPVGLTVRSLPLAASGVLAIPVTCQLSTGCVGTVTTRLVDSAASAARRRKAPAKRFRIKPGQSKKVPVVLDRRSARVVKRKGRARVKITIAIDGAPTVSKEVTVLQRRRPTRNRRAAQPTSRGGKRGGRRNAR